jgi:hypothetical protein
MKLDFCVVCGNNNLDDLHQHHIFPVVYTDGKRRKSDETITVCSEHHKKIHGVSHHNGYDHNLLVREGIEKSRNSGTVWGRPSTMTKAKITKVMDLRKMGVGVRETCRILEMSPSTYYDIIRHDDPYSLAKNEKPHLKYTEWNKERQKESSSEKNFETTNSEKLKNL